MCSNVFVSTVAAEHAKRPISIVQAVLSTVLPNIISKPLSIDAPSNELEAQMLEIEQTMRRFVIQATDSFRCHLRLLHPKRLKKADT